MLFQSFRKLHLCSPSTCYNFVCFEAAPHDHDSIIEWSLGFLNELLSSPSQDNGSWLGLNKEEDTLGHSSKRLNLSAPICLSSNLPHVPKTSGVTLLTVVCKVAPVALVILLISSCGTLPAQKIPRSANHWVARSPMGNLERTILAPTSWIFCSFS